MPAAPGVALLRQLAMLAGFSALCAYCAAGRYGNLWLLLTASFGEAGESLRAYGSSGDWGRFGLEFG